MATKSHQLQIRVTPDEKYAIRRLARDAGLDVSSYVLARALPAAQVRFDGLLRALPDYERNYVAAMVELACARKDRPPPGGWGRHVPRFRGSSRHA